MNRIIRGAAVAAALLAAAPAASADPIVVEVLGRHIAVDPAVIGDVELPVTPGGGVIREAQRILKQVGGTEVTVVSPVVGYILIEQTGGGAPTWQAGGALTDGALWTCSAPAYVPGSSFSVTCTPTASNTIRWSCAVLHADVTTTSAAARARTSMDCTGDGLPEAQTAVALGIDHDSVWASADVPVTTFVCTIDGGPLLAAVPDLRAGCGDPGLPSVSIS